MFTPAPSSPGFSWPLTTSVSNPPTSSGRGSRLRDLIHLRSHTISSRESDTVGLFSTRSQSSTNQSNHANTTHHANNDNTPTSPSSSSPSAAREFRHPEPQATASPTAHPDAAEPSPVNRPPLLTVATTDASDLRLSSRRRTTRYSESAAEALLHSRAGSDPDLAPQPTGPSTMTRTRSATTGDVAHEPLPSIRFSAFYDPRSNRPSLTFSPIARTLPTGKEVIKVGRYSERENHAPAAMSTPSAAPVGFKSKVVSRRHCEFWHEKGRWYIKDVKSSSGTFLNHIRLSAPGTESKPYPVNDGDIVQLGIDFKGGEEMIYRCVKMRVELNRGWQAKPNTFNMATHKRLRDLTSATASAHAQDCSICLSAIAPCQSLFVAPCSHTWHFKCIREMLHGPSWPIFMCPNCRATADLDAEVDEPSDEWQQLDSGAEEVAEEQPAESSDQGLSDAPPSSAQIDGREDTPASPEQGGTDDITVRLDSGVTASLQAQLSQTTTDPVPIPNAGSRTTSHSLERRTPSPNEDPLLNIREGPITPRNDAGPWVFDGNPARVSQESTSRNAMVSLDAAAQAGS